jgi:hypothetical protein
MLQIRPGIRPVYDALCQEGQPFPDERPLVPHSDLTFRHPKKGEQPIMIDRQMVAAQGTLYAADRAVQSALADQGIKVKGKNAAIDLLDRHLDRRVPKLVWGFSGYATGGIDPLTGLPYTYYDEAEALRELYGYLTDQDKLPSLAIDGGVRTGFLGLSSLVAECAGVPTLGFLPKEGLGEDVGNRDHMVIAGDTYQDREQLVATADVLVCAGGWDATMRECKKAVENGAAVLVLDCPKYRETSVPKRVHTEPELQDAIASKQLVVCDTLGDISSCVDKLLEVDVMSSRHRRAQAIARFMLDT